MAASFVLSALALAGIAQAHVAAFAPGMYCQNGTDPNNPNPNSNAPVSPLYNLTQDQWWFQHDRGCDKVPPPPGVFLELPAGGSFNVDLANNQAFSKLSWDGTKTSDWPDGGDHPEDWTGWTGTGEGCIQDSGWIHTQNETSAQGTAFAIAYESDLNKITMEDLVVFTTLEHTPWKRSATYQVPAAMPACPEDGCTCAWLWVPRGCGQPNIYMQGFKCMVTGATSTAPLAKAQPPVMCDQDTSKCVKGAKQMIVWNQLTGNNVVTTGSQTPAYNLRNGFAPGPQDDIFEDSASAPSPPASSSSTPPLSAISSASISITSVPSAPTHVQSPTTPSSEPVFSILPVSDSPVSSSRTTFLTAVKPASMSSGISSIPSVATPVTPISSLGGGSPATVTVTVTASPTHSGHHYTDCWVDGDELDN
ncbi:hypothetical protein G647_08618 [Cladophialophora carrionii CBS 160.54]|uniref:Uncharacterized protein n=1 Tax=Cladophialophora carrionii CBS 160.54 TaxID=1279043 RepID=V9D118_9EURO|nr:uncharacterized protein G647_08618 [Cladophialophora carrionii CBS 160.54]ETI20580.1 hypothetical protein G647_08618 [Cladophialophora carrionii CBS 160.54]